MHIGLVTPSAPIPAFCPKRLARGIAALQRHGHKVTVGVGVLSQTGFTAGSAEERVADIHAFFDDPSIDLIMATIGGYNANDLLPLLDFDRIAKNPKPFIGYSDITILLHPLHERSGVPAYLGPVALPQFGELPDVLPFTLESFTHVLSHRGDGSVYELPVSSEWTEEFLAWDKDDIRPRVLQKNPGWQIIRAGQTSGRLSGGNLRCLLTLAGTPYWPKLDGTILFLEDDDEESAATLQRMLLHLKQTGAFDQIRGIVLGRYQAKSQITSRVLKEIVDRVLGDKSLPVIAGIDMGHTDPMLTLPLGAMVTIGTDAPSIQVAL